MDEALLIVGHGSRDREGIDEFLALGQALAQRRGGLRTAVAFLEFARPTIEEALGRLVADGARRIVCQPGMLFAAGHVKNDVPSELQAAMRRWPQVEFRMGWALGLHAKLLDLCRVRWDETCRSRPLRTPRESFLVVVGRGASDPDANGNVAKISRFLWEGYGAGWAAPCYSGVTKPLVPEALEIAARSGFQRIVVQPYFLFNGILVKRIHHWTRQCAEAHPDLEIFSTGHLGVHPLLVDVFLERAREAIDPHTHAHGAGVDAAAAQHNGESAQFGDSHHGTDQHLWDDRLLRCLSF